jgi:hypothetical protein
MSTQIRINSNIHTQLASVRGAGPVPSWTRPLKSGQSFAEDSRFFLESESLPQAAHRAGCIRGILWAFGFQAAAVVLAIVVFKIFHAA